MPPSWHERDASITPSLPPSLPLSRFPVSSRYDASTGEHSVHFNDGDKRNYKLQKKTFRCRPPAASFSGELDSERPWRCYEPSAKGTAPWLQGAAQTGLNKRAAPAAAAAAAEPKRHRTSQVHPNQPPPPPPQEGPTSGWAQVPAHTTTHQAPPPPPPRRRRRHGLHCSRSDHVACRRRCRGGVSWNIRRRRLRRIGRPGRPGCCGRRRRRRRRRRLGQWRCWPQGRSGRRRRGHVHVLGGGPESGRAARGAKRDAFLFRSTGESEGGYHRSGLWTAVQCGTLLGTVTEELSSRLPACLPARPPACLPSIHAPRALHATARCKGSFESRRPMSPRWSASFASSPRAWICPPPPRLTFGRFSPPPPLWTKWDTGVVERWVHHDFGARGALDRTPVSVLLHLYGVRRPHRSWPRSWRPWQRMSSQAASLRL